MRWSRPRPRCEPRPRQSAVPAPRPSQCAIRGEERVLPDHRAAHAETDAQRGEPVADFWMLPESAGQVNHQSNTGAGEGMAESNRAAIRVEPRIIGSEPEMITEGEYLNGERLVDLEGPNIINRQLGLRQRLL